MSDSGQNTLTSLQRKQELLAHHVRMIARRQSHALFVFGNQGGLGKSRTVNKTLDAEGVTPVLINSHVTPLALYTILHEHCEDSVLFFDDVDSMFCSMEHLGLLRSALWGIPRTVTYSSSQLKNLPQSFEFTSRCIFACNVIPTRNAAFQAVLNRCDQFELSATNSEVIELMRSVASTGVNGVSTEECRQIIDFIEDNASDREISMRLLNLSFRKFQYSKAEGVDWRPMILNQLRTLGRKSVEIMSTERHAKDLSELQKVIEQYPASVEEQELAWRQATNKSRATFYRKLKQLKEMAM